jgi:hypothetical protein
MFLIILLSSIALGLLVNNLVEVSVVEFPTAIMFVFWLAVSFCTNHFLPFESAEMNNTSNIAFFAATPLQVFNCFNIKINHKQNEKADLFLFSFATDLTGILKNAQKSGVFENVYLLNEPFNKIGRLKFLKSYLFPNREVKKLLKSKCYSEMFSTRVGPANDFFYTHLQRGGNGLKFNYYEEGVGDYYYPIERPQQKMLALIGFFGYKNPFSAVESVWLYHPDFRSENLQYQCNLIHTVNKHSEFANQMLRIFDAENIGLPANCKVIFFDQAYKQQMGIELDNLSVLSHISQKVPKEQIYVKLHPRTESDEYEKAGYKILDFGSVPWEVALSAIHIESTALVCVNSTAAVSPKAMFGFEPRVVLLYKFFNHSGFMNLKGQSDYFEKIRPSYLDFDKFSTPENVFEIDKIFDAK